MASRMRLYVLRQLKEHEGSQYDKVEGFVIAASTTTQARKLAAKECADEGGDYWLDHNKSRIRCIANSSKYSTSRIVLRDCNNG